MAVLFGSLTVGFSGPSGFSSSSTLSSLSTLSGLSDLPTTTVLLSPIITTVVSFPLPTVTFVPGCGASVAAVGSVASVGSVVAVG